MTRQFNTRQIATFLRKAGIVVQKAFEMNGFMCAKSNYGVIELSARLFVEVRPSRLDLFEWQYRQPQLAAKRLALVKGHKVEQLIHAIKVARRQPERRAS